jgi:hypothetical protein
LKQFYFSYKPKFYKPGSTLFFLLQVNLAAQWCFYMEMLAKCARFETQQL